MFEMTAVKNKLSSNQKIEFIQEQQSSTHLIQTQNNKRQQKQLTSAEGLDVGDTDGLLLGLCEGDKLGLDDG